MLAIAGDCRGLLEGLQEGLQLSGYATWQWRWYKSGESYACHAFPAAGDTRLLLHLSLLQSHQVKDSSRREGAEWRLRRFGVQKSERAESPRGNTHETTPTKTPHNKPASAILSHLPLDCIGARLVPHQVGVGTPGGTETVAHALASALAEDPETVVISVDMANAFNSIHRAAMLAAVRQSAPASLPMVQWAYGEETPLHIVGAPEGAPPVMSQR